MENNNELDIINPASLRRRIKRELELLQEDDYYTNILYVIQEDNDRLYNITTYKISIHNNVDNRTYEFIVPTDYPFRPPKLSINYRFYSVYQKSRSQYFTDALIKYKGISCLCCESILCSNNWSPNLGFTHIFAEVSKFKDYCREIAYRVMIDVVKRKYLIDDINIVDWLY
jgi:ubiquitin-protein ligase